MPTKPFSTYRYSAFLSYAHDDDGAWNSWISNFGSELDLALVSRLRGIKVPRSHLSSKNGPIQGQLNEVLRRNVEASYAMVLLVHDNYVDSEWCLQELKHFRSFFGEQGFRERLYIVAMSDDAINQLTNHPTWHELFPFADQIWMPFFQQEHRDRPVAIYATNDRQKRVVVTSDFWDRFVELREDLAGKIRRDVEAERHESSYPSATPAEALSPVTEDSLIRVYVEGSQEQHKYWEPLGKQVVASWDQVVALERVEPPLYLRPTGLPLADIDSRPMLDDADGVVLLWGKKTPDSLAAQISQVEPKLSGPHFAPGLVAYLMENIGDQPTERTIYNWPVVRFAARPDGSVTVLADDAPTLAKFLRSTLAHKRAATESSLLRAAAR
jgi:hypothetical protein